jgi:EF hand
VSCYFFTFSCFILRDSHFFYSSFREIDAQEFILAVGYLSNRSLEDVVETSFRCIDLNGDGFISKGGKLTNYYLKLKLIG